MLKPGAKADVTLLQLADGHFELEDAAGEKVTASRRLVPIGVVRNGVQVPVRRPHPR
ncbi:MAG TPA: hypothetical protein VGX21_21425 [Methylomirabilota bacterium]|jgi:predicted amidohydrolase|nr:hypothetical protein [Methylomirabilota bacterium]